MNDVKPVYVLAGSDTFLRDEHRHQIVAAVIGDGDAQTAVSSFDASAELATVLDELRTMPFLAPRRVVILDDADAFVSAHREPLERYLASPAAHSTLLLMVNSWPKNTRIAKLAAKIGETRDCAAPDQRDLPGWLGRAAKKRGKKIDNQAAVLLAQWRGADLASLESEIEKLSIYVGDRPAITVEDVSSLVAASAGAGPYDLTNAITDQNPSAALRALAASLTQRGEEFRTLGMLAWHLRRVLSVASAMAQGASPDAACKAAGVYYRQQQEFVNLVRRRPLSRLQDDFRRLLAADLSLKTGADATSTLQELVVSLSS
jgi:DNA polymerase-3 subunit delta